MHSLAESFAAGYASLSAWADLLDRINVFPVADADTGTNLRISLAPLRQPGVDGSATARQLTLCATGNSGNIAAAFFQDFCQAEHFSELAEKAASGREHAWRAISDPRPGTMLSVFDRLAEILAVHLEIESVYAPLCKEMQEAVRDTTHLLSDLARAGVVDSGALAMYIFLRGFFHHLTGQQAPPDSIFDLFSGGLTIAGNYLPQETDSHCIDALIHADTSSPGFQESLASLGDSLVVVEDEDTCKVHIHTSDPVAFRSQLALLGDVVKWSDEKIVQRATVPDRSSEKAVPLHIVTDAAGSLPKELARQYNITLLDSYIVAGATARPESLCKPEHIYPRMRQGEKLTTAQASTFERHQHYQSICVQHGPSLYLCVGSAFTGNYQTAMSWKNEHDPADQFRILDTGAASGRLALIALTTARFSGAVTDPDEVVSFAGKALTACEEFVFIDELKYLVAGGRLAKTSGFVGDLLHMKPVISPTREGARKVGVVRSRKGQLGFALAQLEKRFFRNSQIIIMLQYSDNEQWVSTVVQPKLQELIPHAEILCTPLSLTSGVHMGPGTWSMAFSSQNPLAAKT